MSTTSNTLVDSWSLSFFLFFFVFLYIQDRFFLPEYFIPVFLDKVNFMKWYIELVANIDCIISVLV